MKYKAKYLKFVTCISLLVLFIAFPFAGFSQTKDKIRIGTAAPLSGAVAPGAGMSMIPSYKMWVEEVNARGGIFVKEFGKRLPVELIMYDDKSDPGTCVRLFEKLILDDKVDLLLPPYGTAWVVATAPIISKHEYPVIGSHVSSEKLAQRIYEYPYYFQNLNLPRHQGPALVDLIVELGIKRAAVIYLAHTHGIEWIGPVAAGLGFAGIDVVLFKSYPLGVKDLSLLLKEIKALEVDALVAATYPSDLELITEQSMVIGFNPKFFSGSVGTGFPTYRDKFGAATLEGVIGGGAWNPKVPYPGAREYFERHLKRWGKEPDRWGSAYTYASLQVLEQAIEISGTLDRKKLRDIIATKKFSTIIGPVKFEGQINAYHPGHIGQWQKGEYEIIAPKEKRTAAPIFPKPPWPKK